MGATILFVDDDKEDELMLYEGLMQPGFLRIKFCPDGIKAITHLSNLSNTDLLSLIVSDLHLPILNGLALTKALKANHRYKEIPIVIYSG